jgi:hypothetical protein
METTIKNFSKCELDKAYFVNEHELIIRSISIKESGKCRHNLYTGEVDGEFFNELNSPQLKRLLGIDTIEYNRDGGDGTPKTRKEITPESIDAEVTKVDARWEALNETIIKLLGDEPTDVVRHVLWDLVEQKKKHLREELEEKMMVQMAAKASREAKAKDAEKDEARKQLCAELGTTLSAVKKMAEAMGASVDEMIQNLQAMKK